MAEMSAADDDVRTLSPLEPADDRISSPDSRWTWSLRELADRARLWLRWFGPGRLATAVVTALVVAGVGWWLLRSPTLPVEATLPSARSGAVGATTTSFVATSSPTPSSTAPPTSPATVVVHVAGAVNDPGVYELPSGRRVADALTAAGGATADADADALNLAAPVIDGDRIAVPTVGEQSPDPPVTIGSGHSHAASADEPTGDGPAGQSAPVDLNEASVSELESLPGIGPATAAAIVEHRTQNGPFATADDLMDVPGIGPAKLAAVRELVIT